MQFLAPMTAIAAAAASVPLLVLLYFLKLRRREVPISSTLLWQRAVRDLQVNAPFQRLRRNLLLLLQLLALAAILLALARPVATLTAGPGRRYVLLIDRSASMNAADARPSRLAQAKAQAKDLVDSLRSGAALALQDRSDQAMVIAFDEHAKVMCNFTSSKEHLRAAIDSIEPTDGASRLGEAVAVARAFAASPGREANDRSAEPPARLELFSDGRIADLEQVVVGADEVGFHGAGTAGADNVGIVAMEARRSYERAEEATVFASLANFGPREAVADVQLSVDGNVKAVRRVTLAARQEDKGGLPGEPPIASVSFDLVHTGQAVLEVRLLRPDALAADNAAWAVLQPPRRLRALLVTGGNVALTAAMRACPLARLDVLAPADFDALPAEKIGADAYDLVVLDNHVRPNLPRNRYLAFGRIPEGFGCEASGRLGGQVVADWQGTHSVMQHVNLSNLFVASCAKLKLPPEAAILAEFNDAPAVALVQRRGGVLLLVNFDLMESNWPFDPSFVMFCCNAMNFLALESGGEASSAMRVGQAITVRGAPGGETATVSGPGFTGRKLPADASGTFRYPRTDRAGVYEVAVPGRAKDRFVANLLDPFESDIRPQERIVFSGQAVAAVSGPVGRANQELWPYLAAIVLVVVCLEWLVYNLKVRL